MKLRRTRPPRRRALRSSRRGRRTPRPSSRRPSGWTAPGDLVDRRDLGRRHDRVALRDDHDGGAGADRRRHRRQRAQRARTDPATARRGCECALRLRLRVRMRARPGAGDRVVVRYPHQFEAHRLGGLREASDRREVETADRQQHHSEARRSRRYPSRDAARRANRSHACASADFIAGSVSAGWARNAPAVLYAMSMRRLDCLKSS